MSLSSGKGTYTDNVLKLKDARFNTAYVPYDELYALYVEGNGFLLNLESTNNLVGTDDDYSYGLNFAEDANVDGRRQWIINGIDDNASLSLMGDMYCQSLGDENQAQLTVVDSRITVTDKAYFWQEDNVDLLINNSELDLRNSAWPDQNIMEYFNSVTLQGCHFADGCYWDAQENVVKDSSGQPAMGRVRILRGSDGGKKGDVNSDNSVNTGDVTAVYNYIINGSNSGFSRDKANVHGDAEVNTADVTAIYNIIINGVEPTDPSTPKIYTVNGVIFKMVEVEGGTFQMGSNTGKDNEKPVHSVTLSSYSIGETEVTQALWYAVMGSNPSTVIGDNRPVQNVSWDDCQTFIQKLYNLTGKKFRLPTEAEWEFAARGGKKSKGYKYSGSNTIGDVAYWVSNSTSTHEVATKSPNELGIYDMSGNVEEWCQDWYGSYSSGAHTNPTGPDSGNYRVMRGGSWNNDSIYCGVTVRSYGTPNTDPWYTYPSQGLRLAQ